MTGHQDLIFQHGGTCFHISKCPWTFTWRRYDVSISCILSDAVWFYLAHALYGSHKDVIKYNERSTITSNSDPQCILFCDSPDCWAKIFYQFFKQRPFANDGRSSFVSRCWYIFQGSSRGGLSRVFNSEMYSL